MRFKNWYDRSPMWPLFNHGCPKPAPEEPYNSPYAVLGYDELGAPVFTVHTVAGEEYTVPVENDIIVLKDTTYTLSMSEDHTTLILKDSYGNETSISLASDEDVPGFLSVEDKAKLDGIETGAQVNKVTGVKGSAEASYRTGNVSISKDDLGLTKADVGLSHVENLSPEELFTTERIDESLGHTQTQIVKKGEGTTSLAPGQHEWHYFGKAGLGVDNMFTADFLVQVLPFDDINPYAATDVIHHESVSETDFWLYLENTSETNTFSVRYTVYVITCSEEA